MVAIHRRWYGRLDEVVGKLRRSVLDVNVEVEVKRGVNAGCRRTDRRPLQLIGKHGPGTTTYSFYLTQIPPNPLRP